MRIASKAYLPVGKLAAVLPQGFTELRSTLMATATLQPGLVAAMFN